MMDVCEPLAAVALADVAVADGSSKRSVMVDRGRARFRDVQSIDSRGGG